jgi:hypothetical protein
MDSLDSKRLKNGDTRHLVVSRNEGVVGRKGPRRALPVNEERLRPSVDHVLFHFGNVVRHVVNDVHVLDRYKKGVR